MLGVSRSPRIAPDGVAFTNPSWECWARQRAPLGVLIQPLSTFAVGLRNLGDTTIRDLTLEITQNPESHAWFFIGVEQGHVSEALPKRWRLPEGERIHPGECLEFPEDLFSVIPGSHWDGSATPASM